MQIHLCEAVIVNEFRIIGVDEGTESKSILETEKEMNIHVIIKYM